jgi:peptidoglycan/LPS O-acetylase OafA/YrhL
MRKNFIDNLRWMAIFLLFPYHVFMIYNNYGEVFYINGIGNALLSNFIYLVWPWFMPFLFVLAGISSNYALKNKSPVEYLKERFLRLFIPLISGILIIIPCMPFLADKFHNGYTGNYFQHYILFFTKWTNLTGSDGSFTPGHLWFIFYLFIISLITFPIMVLYNKTNKKIPIQRINILILILLFIFPLIGQLILDISRKSLGEYGVFFMLGYLILSDNTISKYFLKSSFGIYLFHQPWIIIVAYNVFKFINKNHGGYIWI